MNRSLEVYNQSRTTRFKSISSLFRCLFCRTRFLFFSIIFYDEVKNTQDINIWRPRRLLVRSVESFFCSLAIYLKENVDRYCYWENDKLKMSSPRIGNRSHKIGSSKKNQDSEHANSTDGLHKKGASSPDQSKTRRRASITGHINTRSKSEVRKHANTDTRTKSTHPGKKRLTMK